MSDRTKLITAVILLAISGTVVFTVEMPVVFSWSIATAIGFICGALLKTRNGE